MIADSRPTVRVVHFGARDVGDILFGSDEGSHKLPRGLIDVSGTNTRLEIVEGSPGGWARTLEALRSMDQKGDGAVEVLVTSVSAEVVDPSPDPRDSLVQLGREAQAGGRRVIVMNASSIVPGEVATGRRDGEPNSLRIRRLNLAVMEASNATGLSVLDADRRIAETPFSSKVVGPCDYTPPMCEVLQEEAARILRELGLTVTRSVLELRVPFITKAIHLNVERWLKGPGDSIASGDVICELRLLGTRRMTRPTSALFLASIGGGKPLIRRVFSRERMLRRRKDVKMSVVSSDAGVLRQILRREGDAVKTNDPLALLTDREDTLFGSDGQPSIFRAVARSDDVSSELLL